MNLSRDLAREASVAFGSMQEQSAPEPVRP